MHQERLNDIMKDTSDAFPGCKTLNKVYPIYLEGKLKEATFCWGLKTLKTEKNKKQRATD